jgi:3-oxoacyl-[acyl-carrier protein] reductase
VGADVGEIEALDALVEAVKGRGELQVLVNNAGATADAPFLTAKLEDLERIYRTNMRATWYLTKKLARVMARKRFGRIINVSSVVGSTGNFGQTIYGMTKAAIDNLTRSLALELAPYGILVNAVAPGFIETRMTEVLPAEAKEAILQRIPLGRMGRPEEVARLVRYLAVEDSYCTGTVFHINGGMYGG